jgi:hypothetical protein
MQSKLFSSALIQALVDRGFLKVVTGARSGQTNGRASEFVIIPPLPSQQNPVGLLLPSATADSSK